MIAAQRLQGKSASATLLSASLSVSGTGSFIITSRMSCAMDLRLLNHSRLIRVSVLLAAVLSSAMKRVAQR
jgi:hypothetical protein